MKKYLLLFLSLLLMILSKVNGNDSYSISEDGKTLFYLNYVVEKRVEVDNGFENHIMILKRKTGGEIKRFEMGSSIEEMNTWEICDLIKGDNEELIIKQYSGGAHCCEYNWVYEFSDQPVEIFNSFDYGSLGFMAPPEDLNGDGNYELILQDLTFDYFYRCCHAASPINSVVFEYDVTQGKYIIQNIKFKDFLMPEGNGNICDEFDNIKPTDKPGEVDPGGYYLGSILTDVIAYLYAGEAQKAWEIFDKNYILSDKEEIKDLILKKLESDACYQ